MWENCHVTLNDAQVLKKCDPIISEEKSKLILDELTKNKTLLEELRYYMSGIKVGMDTITEQLILCEVMLDEINKIQNR